MAQKRLEGWHVAFVGAAAKAIVFMNALGILPDNVYDEAPLKIGKWIPGHLEPILDLKEIEDVDGPVLAIVGAWNFDLARKTAAPPATIRFRCTSAAAASPTTT